MLTLDDFYVDTLLVRQIRRAIAAQSAADASSDFAGSDDEEPNPGSQRRRPEEIDSESDDVDTGFATERAERDRQEREAAMRKVKRERMSQGVGGTVVGTQDGGAYVDLGDEEDE